MKGPFAMNLLGRHTCSSLPSLRPRCQVHSFLQRLNTKQRALHNRSKATRSSPGGRSIAWQKGFGSVKHFFLRFHQAQLKRPLTVQLCASALISFCGDVLAQKIGQEKYDGSRTLRMVLIGMIASTPGYKWFIFLGRHFNYASRWRSIATKVLIHQAVFVPVFNTYFFGMQALLTGEPPLGVVRRVQDAAPTSVMNSFKFWPAVTAFNFTFVMPEYRFMFSAAFAICWQTYLSLLNRRTEMGYEMQHQEVSAV